MADYTKQVNKEIQFRDQSTNTPVSWSWNFGDGTTSTVKDPRKTYTTTGTRTVSLVTSNSCGQCTSVSKTVEIVTELPKEAGGINIALTLAAIVAAAGIAAYLMKKKKSK